MKVDQNGASWNRFIDGWARWKLSSARSSLHSDVGAAVTEMLLRIGNDRNGHRRRPPLIVGIVRVPAKFDPWARRPQQDGQDRIVREQKQFSVLSRDDGRAGAAQH